MYVSVSGQPVQSVAVVTKISHRLTMGIGLNNISVTSKGI